jgi:dihydrofolate reductase
MNIIVAVFSDWGIGKNGTQQIIIPEDRRFFKEITMGKTIITGRKTFEDIGKPLPGRKNIILTRDRNFKAKDVQVENSVDSLLKKIVNTAETFVIGGENIYNALLPHCSLAYVTKIDANPTSDRFFPNLDEAPCWSAQKVLRSGVFNNININCSKPIRYSIILSHRSEADMV